MAHQEQYDFVERVSEAFPEYFRDSRVLEIGSAEIGGSVRSLFPGCDYTGVDLSEGEGVDRIAEGQLVDDPSGSYDVVVSCECFEHNPYWLETFVNMIRMLRPGGLCLMSCALLGRQEHGTARMDPQASWAEGDLFRNYYRNLVAKDFTRRLDMDLHFQAWAFHENIYHKDLYLVALKHGGAIEDAEARLGDLMPRIREIRSRRPKSALSANLRHAIKVCAVRLLGERRYHDIKYRVRRRLKRAYLERYGEERYEAMREKQKSRDPLRREGDGRPD